MPAKLPPDAQKEISELALGTMDALTDLETSLNAHFTRSPLYREELEKFKGKLFSVHRMAERGELVTFKD